MKRKLYFKNDKWRVIIHLDRPIHDIPYDDSLFALGLWIISEIKGCWCNRKIL